MSYNLLKIHVKPLVIVIMYASAALGIMLKQSQTVTMMIVSVCMLYLSYQGQIFDVFPLALLLNDDIGSIPGGFSIYFVCMVCYLLDFARYPNRRIIGRSIALRRWGFYLFAVVYNVQLLVAGSLSLQRTMIGVFLMVWTVNVLEHMIYENGAERLLKIFVATTAFLVVISTLSGYQNIYGGAYGNHITRAGLLGHGAGADPNFAGLTIVVSFLLLLMSTYEIKTKVVFAVILIFGLIRTVSLTAIGVFSISIFLYTFIRAFREKQIWGIRVLSGLTVLIAIAVIIYNAADMLGNESLISLRDRIQEAIFQITIGDWNDVNSGRSSILSTGLIYWQSQGLLKQLFGGNGLFVLGYATHNTYLDMLLRFGAVGAGGMALYILKCFYRSIRVFRNPADNVSSSVTTGVIALKVSMLIYSSTIAINQGISLCLWTTILFFL